MSKLSKLRNNPSLFVFDAIKNNIPVNLKKNFTDLIGDMESKPTTKVVTKTITKTVPSKILENFKDILMVEGGGSAKTFLSWITLSEGINISKKMYVTLAQYEIENGNFSSVKDIIEFLNTNKCYEEALYCEGLYFFYRKELTRSVDSLLNLIVKIGYKNKLSVYLLAESYILSDNKEMARKVLINNEMLKQSKTWLLLANMVDKEEELLDLILLYRESITGKIFSRYNVKINEYMALSALRIGKKEIAKDIWRDLISYFYSKEQSVNQNINYSKNYTSRKAEKALVDLNNLFKSNNLEFFLVSGTLLGAIRENQLLGHDNDIDVGVFDQIPPQEIYNIIKESEKFFELKSRSDKIIRLKHINGINIDIFYHYEEDDFYWHSGVKVKWKNSKFITKEIEFLDEIFSIPENPELYLSENYGEGWIYPQPDFDSTFDTPNGYIIDEDEAIIYSYKMLIKYRDNSDKLEYYLQHLEKLGDFNFVEKMRHINELSNQTIP